MDTNLHTNTSPRLISIDRMRGVMIFAMIFFQLCEEFPKLGFLSRVAKHYVENGGIPLFREVSLADTILPMFAFLLVLTFIPSFRRRASAEGKKSAYRHFIIRYLSILGLGGAMRGSHQFIDDFGDPEYWHYTLMFVFIVIAGVAALCLLVFSLAKADEKKKRVATQIMLGGLCTVGILTVVFSALNAYYLFYDLEHIVTCGRYQSWDVLSTLGACGLLLLLFVNEGTVARGLASGLFFAMYMLFYNHRDVPIRMGFNKEGGLPALCGWLALFLAYSVLADLFWQDLADRQEGKKGRRYLIALPCTLVLAAVAALWMTVLKNPITPGFVLFSLGLSPTVFGLFYLTERWKPGYRPFVKLGKSPLLMFLLQFIFHNIVFQIIGDTKSWPGWLGLLISVSITGFIWSIAYWLDKRNIIVHF